MRDMKEGIQKAIADLGFERDLSESDKRMIEAGYMQCALQVTYDIGMCEESFIGGLHELVQESKWYPESLKPDDDREVLAEIENGFTIIATWMKGFGYWMSVNGEVKGVRYWREKPERTE